MPLTNHKKRAQKPTAKKEQNKKFCSFCFPSKIDLVSFHFPKEPEQTSSVLYWQNPQGVCRVEWQGVVAFLIANQERKMLPRCLQYGGAEWVRRGKIDGVGFQFIQILQAGLVFW